MNILFLMDPLERVHPTKDTSLALMVGAQRRGHEVFYVPNDGVSTDSDGVRFRATRVEASYDASAPFRRLETRVVSQREVGAVFIRTDPPFDARYLTNTWLLDRLPAFIPVINRPAGLRAVSEKLWAAQFVELIPTTLVTADAEAGLEFVRAQREVVVKPVDGYGGQSVFRLRDGDPNLRVTLETLGRAGLPLVYQAYVPEADAGDKRILLLNGEPLGVVLRVHGDGDHRNNFMAGGRPAPADITADDRRIIDVLAPRLQELGLVFVGIDVIGGKLIEVNVTSPTCLQEMNRLYGQRLEDRVIECVERMA